MHGQQNVKMKTNISRSGLLRMRNLTDKSCRENQNTQFMLIIPFPKKKTLPFMRKSAKIWYSQRGYRYEHNTTHSHYMLDNLKLHNHTQNM